MNKGKNATFLKAGEDNIHIEKVGRYPDPSLFKSKEIHKREKKITIELERDNFYPAGTKYVAVLYVECK